MLIKGWVGFDLDGTLAVYDGFKGPEVIGEPIPEMIEQVKRFLARGVQVKIFTARVWSPPIGSTSRDRERQTEALLAKASIIKWCQEHIGVALEVTCVKDYGMLALFDDRAIQVRMNTGEILGDVLAVLNGGERP